MQDVILEAHEAGIVFVAAAGNNGNNRLVYPAAYDKVIAVSATDHNDVKAGFSSYGTFIDVAAPGVNIFSTKLNGTYGYASGTSMACPHVAGFAALLKSLDNSLTPDQVEGILKTTTDDLGDSGWDTFYGSGRINAYWALQAVVQQETSFATARIFSPAEGQEVSGVTLDISGTAAGNEFVDYTVEYAAGDGTWSLITSADANPYVIPTVADLDDDGTQEIITAGPDERIRVYRKDASFYPGFPVILNAGDYFRWAVNVDDLDGDGTTEIIAVVSNTSSNPPSRILILKHDGTPFPGWPSPGLDRGVNSSDQTPAVADLNGDGAKELVTIEVFTWVDRTDVTLHAFGLDGAELAGFPRQLTLPPVGFDADELFPSRHGVPSIADLDNDGHPEIAWSYSNRIYLFDHEGNVLPGWPFIAPDYNGKIMVFENAAAGGDIDGDGQLELFSIGRGQNCGYCETQLYGWRKDGSILPGWPKTDQTDDIKLLDVSGSQNTPALVDIDGDGSDEVLVGLNKLTVFDGNGALPFAAGAVGSHSQPSPSDVDGDGLLEFSANWYNTISIADDDGSYFWKRIMPGGGTRNTPGLFADLDDDGTMELVLVHADRTPSIALYVWEIPRPGASPAREEWQMFNHDSARSGHIGFNVAGPPVDDTPPVCAIEAPADGSTVSGATAVVISASDNLGVTRVELYLDNALVAADVSNPYSIPLDTRATSNGNHILLARAYDAAGNVGPSPQITVTVSNDATPPDAPALVSPADGLVTASATPTFSWTVVSDPSGVRYRMQADDSPGFSSPEIDVGNLEQPIYTPVGALGDGTYRWRVLAVDGAGNAGAWSGERTFSIETRPCSPAAPVMSVSPLSRSAFAGTTLGYGISITNTDSGNCAASTFYLSSSIPVGWTGPLAPDTLTLQPGQTGQATLAVTSADSAAPGSYGLSMLVSGLAGSTHNNSGAADYTVLESPGDDTPPTAPTGLSADLKPKHVNLSWNAATDNVGVAGYRIWRNGAVLDEITVTGYVDRAVNPGETYNYHVVAFDAAGNVSDSSNSVVMSVSVKANSGKGKPKK